MTDFEALASRAFFRPTGTLSLHQGVERVAQALQRAREQGIEDILVNTMALGGFESPCIFERYAMMTRWAQSAGKDLRIAVVVRPSFIDHQKIGVLIAQNRGAILEVFADETSALDWLDARRARSRARWHACDRAYGY